MSVQRGSIAAASFADAARVLAAALDGAPPATRPAIDYVAPGVAHGEMAGPSLVALADGAGPPAGPLWDAVRGMADGSTTAVALAEVAIAAVEARNDELVGVVAWDPAQVRADAAAADARRAAGGAGGLALLGIPVTVKDVIDVAGLPTRAGSAAYEDHPAVDAVGVARLRAAGAVIVGKVSTHEFALGVTSPQSRNPRDPSRIPGGSSGGSAVAVASGMSLASLGTDTRASIRVPAALSGVVGFKPTYGRVPTAGVVSLSWTMDHVAPMATTVADAALVLDVLAGTSTVAVAGAGVDGLRIGVATAGFSDAEPGVRAAVHAAVDVLVAAGAKADETDRPSLADLDLANAAGLYVSRCEAAAFHRSLGLDRSLYWEEVADQLALATELPAVDYLDAQRARGLLLADLAGLFEHVDLLAMPTSPVVAPPVDDFAQYLMLLARNAIPWSFLGFPAVSVPCGSVGGLPVGLQLVAPWGREDVLVAAGCALAGLV